MLMVLNTIQAPAKVDQQFEQPLCKTIGVPLECVRDQSVVLDLAKKYISEIPTESLWQEYLTLGALDKANPARTFGHALSSHQFDIPLTESQLSTVLLIFARKWARQTADLNGFFLYMTLQPIDQQ